MSVWFCLLQKGKGRGGVGGWTGSGEERDNKAGGDVNSQIGSFSCFPQPATLDGWLRQRPERIRETQAPPEGWGSGGGGGGGGPLEPGWGLWGGYSRGLQGKEWPQETGNSWGNRRKIAHTVYMSPQFATYRRGDSTRGRRTGVHVPSGLQGAQRFRPRG